jgi:hypothetical protein
MLLLAFFERKPTKERFNNILDIPSDAVGIYESRSLERVRLRITFTTIRMNGCGRGCCK